MKIRGMVPPTVLGVLALAGLVARGDAIDEALANRPGLFAGKAANSAVFDAALAKVSSLDRAADRKWSVLKTPEEIAAYRDGLRRGLADAVGGFPERTPLNIRSYGVVERDGYTIEKLLFESRPRHFVTGLLFLPRDSRFKAPYPGVVVTCGHWPEAMHARETQRTCVVLAKSGIASLIYDPIDQGERQQLPGTRIASVSGHVNAGLRAHLVGWGTAQFRIWDGVRALDVLQARKEVDAKRVGVTGMSGGGTLSAYLNAFDTRYRAAAPMGFITTMRALADRLGPQDSEQVIHGQLAFGLNHLALLLMNGGSAVCPGFSFGDAFPYAGSVETYERAHEFCVAEGRGDSLDSFDCAGPHDWYESEKQSLAHWMRRHLTGDASAWPVDRTAFRRMDAGFDYARVDVGLAGTAEGKVLGGKGVMSLPGARSVYDLIAERLEELERTRPKTPDPAAVRKILGLREGEAAVALAERTVETNGMRIVTTALEMSDGTRIPVAAFLPAEVRGVPVMIASDAAKASELVPQVRMLLAEGRPVAVVEARGFGPIAASHVRSTYWSGKGLDQEIAAMLDWCGESLVARRAEDYLAAGAWFMGLTGTLAELRSTGGAVVAAVHAYYFGRDRFVRFVSERAPDSWTHLVRNPRSPEPRFSDLVFGALAVYDWPELIR